MKTAASYIKKKYDCYKGYSEKSIRDVCHIWCEVIEEAQNDVKKEYEEKLRWIPTSEQTPTATEIGDWDGKRSDFVLAKTKNGSHYILRVYEGFSNGEKWVDWADKNDMIHTGIVEWRSFL